MMLFFKLKQLEINKPITFMLYRVKIKLIEKTDQLLGLESL